MQISHAWQCIKISFVRWWPFCLGFNESVIPVDLVRTQSVKTWYCTKLGIYAGTTSSEIIHSRMSHEVSFVVGNILISKWTLQGRHMREMLFQITGNATLCSMLLRIIPTKASKLRIIEPFWGNTLVNSRFHSQESLVWKTFQFHDLIMKRLHCITFPLLLELKFWLNHVILLSRKLSKLHQI